MAKGRNLGRNPGHRFERPGPQVQQPDPRPGNPRRPVTRPERLNGLWHLRAGNAERPRHAGRSVVSPPCRPLVIQPAA